MGLQWTSKESISEAKTPYPTHWMHCESTWSSYDTTSHFGIVLDALKRVILYDWWSWLRMAGAWLWQANKSKGCWVLQIAHSWWSYFSFQLWPTLLCKGEQIHCPMSPSKYHSCTTKLVPTRKGGIACWLSSLLSSRCAWILTIQVCLWGSYGGACFGQ